MQHVERHTNYMKKYENIGTRTNIYYFEGYCYQVFNCRGYIKILTIVRLEQTWNFTKVTSNT